MYLAHIAADREQTVKEHLESTAKYAKVFADAFGCAANGEAAGMAHDIGKFSQSFQKRLQGGPKVDHSTAGAFECCRRRMLPEALCVAGHHGGIPDVGGPTDLSGPSFMARMNRGTEGLPPYSAWSKEIDIPKTVPPDFCRRDPEMMFFTRMLYSCLTDADYIDTASFMSGTAYESVQTDIEALNQSLDEYVRDWYPPKNELNKRRCDILDSCMQVGSSSDRGLFTLTVPTGGGKTVASLAFALRHARRNKMRRIIYVIPYTSIIEQTAEKFRDILGAENVLEHHSGVLFDLDENSTPDEQRKAHASENWDIPVVVTTAVQFFESLYSNKPSKCRKLHNIANSVVIFDEAQMLPLPYLKPCVFAILQLCAHYRVSAVLCTATQPALNGLFREYLPDVSIREICPPELSGDEIFKRVLFRKAGKINWDELCTEMNAVPQALCIVNSRKNAQRVFAGLDGEGSYHLSTLMYPEHRKAVLKEIRKRLEDKMPCRVAATSLVEAGVDVDFPLVYREQAGLDSVLQAAGRCNREGNRPLNESIVSVFRAEAAPPPLFSTAIAAGNTITEKFEDIASPQAVEHYFRELYGLKGEDAMDKMRIMDKMKELPFKTIAESFHIIDSNTKTVYIPKGKGAELAQRLKNGECSRALYREAGQYAVSVYENHFAALLSSGALFLLDDDSAILEKPELYSEKTGLSLEADSGQALFV